MAPELLRAGCDFKQVYCSPARRAQQTIEWIARTIPEHDISWKTDEDLYTFGVENLLRWLRNLHGDLHEVTLVGHNPGMTDLNNYLTHDTIDNLPTCGYLQLRADVPHWSDLVAGCAMQLVFITPK